MAVENVVTTRGHLLDIVVYSALGDTVPQPRRLAWDELAADLLEHDERPEKDGPGWSATVYRPSTTRGKAGVDEVTALVLDVDHDEPAWSLLDGLEYVAHTTWKYHAADEHVDCQGRTDCPHWRIVLPLAHAVSANDWEEFRRRARFWLCPNADESAKDAPRFFWLPACRPGLPRDSRHHRGRWLDPLSLAAVPDAEPRKRVELGTVKPSTNGTGERPGDRFEREADWLRDLLPTWKPVGVHGDNLYLRRPGSTNPYGATISGRGQGVLYVFSDQAAPLEPLTCYSKFGALATLEYDGDFKAAARALAERYGMRATSVRRLRATAHATDAESSAEDQDKGETRPFTDLGNAERLVDQHGQDLRFCFPWGTWLTWDGRRWRRDQNGAARRMAKATVRAMYAEASAVENDDVRKALAGWARKSESSAAIAAMLKLGESERGVPILPEEMDADGFLLNVLNGTVDLKTGQLLPHDRQHSITKLAPVYYDAEAACPTFLAFLARVLPDADVRTFVQRAIGYSLTGDTSAQCLFFMHGGGANGKSTLIGTVHAMLGDYARQAAPELLVNRGGDRHPTELADLFGARLVASIEVDDGKRLAETLVKQMTGGDRLKARYMRTDFFEWTPTHKLFLAANHKPTIRGTDYAMWRRIHLIPFTVTIPEGERDPKLPGRLLTELPGILRWAIDGCLQWQRDGLGVPQAVRDATEAYRAEQDILGDFVADRCVADPQVFVPTGALYKAYSAWCEANGGKAISTQAFGRRVAEHGFESGKGAKGVRIWKGVRLRNADEEPSVGGASGPGGAFLGDFHEPPHDSSVNSSYSVIREKAPEAPPSQKAPPGADRPCWSCHQELNPDIDDRCETCGWLQCPCGACGCDLEAE